MSGTVSETEPTTNRRVPGVLVTTAGGASATTNSDGTFTVTGVGTGTQTLTFAKATFDTKSVSVTVASANVSGVQVNLSPTPRIVETGAIDDMIGPDDPSCSGTSRPCDTYPFGVHNDGVVEGFMLWSNADTDLDFELRCNDQVVEEAARKGTLEELNAKVKGGQSCEMRVIHRAGPAQTYRLFLKYPY